MDGTFIPLDCPALPLLDQAYLSGMGVFETIRAAGGVPHFFEAHHARLTQSAACFDLAVPDAGELRGVIVELLARQGLKSARIRVTVSGAADAHGIPFRFGGETRTTIQAFPHLMSTGAGLRLASAPFRLDSQSPLAGHKCTSYALHALAVRHARKAGCDDALMLDHDGNVVGCATANLFWVKNGEVFTPAIDSGCRDGVTRECVIRICGHLGIPCRETRAGIDALADADEVFATSSIRGVRSVIGLDGGNCCGGGITIRLAEAFEHEAEMPPAATDSCSITNRRPPAG